jgi:hypothetical protein
LKEKKKRDLPTINVIGQLANLIIGKVFTPKYIDLVDSPIVDVYFSKFLISNALKDQGLEINVMTRDNVKDKFDRLVKTHTHRAIQLENSSIVIPKVVWEDVIVSMESWEYPHGFYSTPNQDQT